VNFIRSALGGAVVIPDIGIHRSVPDHVYHRQWEAASNSRLTLLKRSPAHMRSALDDPSADTDALRIGRAAHAAILEPSRFGTLYARGPEGDRRTKEVKAQWAELELRHGPGNVLRPTEFEQCLEIADAVRVHAAAASLFENVTDVELSIAWDDAETNLRCKARIDAVAPILSNRTIVDVKTTRDASLDEFARSIFTLGYHRQAAHYLDGAAAVGLDTQHFVFIAIEKEPPFAVGTYRLREDAIDAGREELRALKHRYAHCFREDHWPAYSSAVEDITLPSWAWRQVVQLEEVA
jgi:exodeoxyribonuclease VIII